MMDKLHPLYDRVLVKRIEQEETSPGGVLIPVASKEKPVEGVVKAVGPGKYVNERWQPTVVKVGDRVLFGKYSGTEVTFNDEEMIVMREDDLLAIIKRT